MKLKPAIPLLLSVWIFWGCEHEATAPPKEPCQTQIDSLRSSVGKEIDSLTEVVTALKAQIANNQGQLNAIRDSAAYVNTRRQKPSVQVFKNKEKGTGAKLMNPTPKIEHQKPQSMKFKIGGEAKGDPIRPNDPPRKEVR